MPTDETTKFQNTLWWIASIAVSVLCCSVLFILFASYLVEVKADVRDNNLRLNVLEEREDKILSDLEAIRKHDTSQAQVPPASATVPQSDAGDTMQTPPVPTTTPTSEPVTPPSAEKPVEPVTPTATVTSPAPPTPTISVPAISTPSENK